MPHLGRVLPLAAQGFLWADPADAFGERASLQDQELAGYFLESPPGPPRPASVRAWGFVVVVAGPPGEPVMAVTTRDGSGEPHHNPLQLSPVGRLVRVATRRPPADPFPSSALRPVASGQRYRIGSAPARGLVTVQLADALAAVFQGFSRERGFTSENPLEIRLSRGVEAGSHGHREGRAADIAAVAGRSFLAWKRAWDRAIAAADALADPGGRAAAISAEQNRNLGYGLYKALQDHGGWRVDPDGWRPYRGVMQLFGPWTALEGPWKTMQIKDPTPYQRQRLADQQWVFRAHQDHIHVAR
jgi:hypothetical protein